jgi:sarcosine oxidase subunit beta
VHDVTHLAYEPDAGYADANATTFAFAQAAKDLGVEFLLDTRVTSIETRGSVVTGVETSDGRIDAPVVLVAAGAWANQLFGPLEIELGVVPSLARVTVFRWPPERSTRHMTYIDHINHTWVRPVDTTSTLIGAEFGVRHGADPEDFSEAVTQDYIDLCREQVVNRFPVMRHSTVRGNWTGILMRSLDSRPILDQLPQYEGLFCITGDSGTSFKTSPAIGKCMAEWIVEGEAKTVDLTPFRSSRFDNGQMWQDEFDYGLQKTTISR